MLRPDFYEIISMFEIFWGFLRTIIPSLPELHHSHRYSIYGIADNLYVSSSIGMR